ncbi:MAG: hypothetical protein HC877_20525 [Thioploca sp.]|nr:hypothetical protein [Thioploca sp.]
MRDWLDKANPTQQEIDPPQPPESEVDESVSNINEPDRFLAAINAFLQVSNDEELQTVFQEYPELFDEQIDPLFEAIIANARE